MGQKFYLNGKNSHDIKRMNITLVMNLIHEEPGITRAMLAKSTGLTSAAITKLIDELLNMELLDEHELEITGRGRPALGLSIRDRDHHVLALKLARTYLSWGIYDLSGALIESGQVLNTIELSKSVLIAKINEIISDCVARDHKLRVACIAVPGPFNSRSKTISVYTEMKNLNSLDLNDLDSSNQLLPLFFVHDANAGAMSEWLMRKQEEHYAHNMAYFLVGEGVGVGVVKQGRIIGGERGMAGELGHVSVYANGERCRCGNYGCLELYCSSISFIRRAVQRSKMFPHSKLFEQVLSDVGVIFDAARAGDELALALCDEVATYIGYGTVNIINCFDPGLIVVGDEMSKGWDILEPRIRRVLNERMATDRLELLEIVGEKQGYDHILHGAASVAILECLNNLDYLASRQ